MVGKGKEGTIIGGKYRNKAKKLHKHKIHRKRARPSIEAISKAAIRRLASRGGVKRISSFIYEDVR